VSWTRAYWIVFVAALCVYGAMLLVTLPAITDAADGLVPFDMRPAGYTPDEARAFLANLSDQGRAVYLGLQHRLDLVYPGLLALVLAGAVWGLTTRGIIRVPLVLLTCLGMIADYTENVFVARMLRWDGVIPDQLAAQACLWTQLKSAATTIVMIAVCLLLVAWGLRKWRGK